jgi:regulator of sigma E protease
VDPIVFIISLAILIIIHELGHFITAKKLGMYVEEFAIGFPPKLIKKKIKETVYSLNLIPIGGYVKIFGESEGDKLALPKNDPDYKEKISRAFYNQSSLKRVVVISAGVFMNFVFGWLIISFVFTRGVMVPSQDVEVVSVAKESPASSAGIKKNDIIKKVADRDIKSSEELIDAINIYLDKKIDLVLSRGNKRVQTSLTPRKNPPAGQGAMGVVISDFKQKQYSYIEAPWLGLKESINISRMFYTEMFKAGSSVLTGKKPELKVSGPVGIYNAYSETQGFFEKLLLTGLISLNLALINIFPFPALDGGHLLFIGIEAVTRKKISTKIKQRITYAGLVMLLLLLALVTVKDVLRLF